MSPLDCQRCGACCVNPPENRDRGYTEYILVHEEDPLLKRRDLVKKLVVLDNEGLPHLRLTADGRCHSLRGALGGRVRCDIYHHRPTPCRRVELGSDLCHWYRRVQGLEADMQRGAPGR